MSEINPHQTHEDINIQRVFWIAVVYTIVAFSSLGFMISTLVSSPSWQAFMATVTSGISFALYTTSLVIVRRNQAERALKIIFWLSIITNPISIVFFKGTTLILAVMLIVVTIVNIYYLFPETWPKRKYLTALVFAVGFMLLVELINPSFRVDAGNTGIDTSGFGPVLTIFIVISVAFIIARLMWTSGRMRSKIIILMFAVFVPVLSVSTYFLTQTQSRVLEQMLLERAQANAISGATTLGHVFEDAIENGTLTQDEVFDRDYIKFWEFDPVTDPDYNPETDGDPASYDKYHTAYDAYTDEHWPALIDTYLTSPDMIYAAAVDVNGYVSTHNTRYASGDGSVATDRTKRIFDDPVGLAAARNTEPTLQQIYVRPTTDEVLWDVSAPIYVNGEHWGAFRVGVQLAESQQYAQAGVRRAVISAVLVLAAALVFAWLFGRFVAGPIERLTAVVTRASEGDLRQHIEIPNRDEITILAQAFNTMIAQLRELVTSLEQRIAERTQALETSTEVSQRLSTILDQRQLVREVVEQVQSGFDYYHVHIYLFDEKQENLEMVGGTGEAGHTMLEQGHSVPTGRGLVGRAADTNLAMLVPDVSQVEGWLPNPLLPETRAEAAIPIALGENVLGVLDVQEDAIGGLTETDIELLQSIANQVAIALRNARAYQRTQQQVAREVLIANINQQIQNTTKVEEALQVAVREVGQTLVTKANVQLATKSNGKKRNS